jgi:thiamine biosynthesis protein ThiS
MRINGKTVLLQHEMTLAELLLLQRFNCRAVAVEVNGTIIPRTEYDSVRLVNEDTLEIVQFVGGG